MEFLCDLQRTGSEGEEKRNLREILNSARVSPRGKRRENLGEKKKFHSGEGREEQEEEEEVEKTNNEKTKPERKALPLPTRNIAQAA
jgi:hypothetical protein